MTEKAPDSIRLIYRAKNLEDSKKVSDYSKRTYTPNFLVDEQD